MFLHILLWCTDLILWGSVQFWDFHPCLLLTLPWPVGKRLVVGLCFSPGEEQCVLTDLYQRVRTYSKSFPPATHWHAGIPEPFCVYAHESLNGIYCGRTHNSSICITAPLVSLLFPGYPNAVASLQLLKSVKLGRSFSASGWYPGSCSVSGQERFFLCSGKALCSLMYTHCVVPSILKGFTFSWKSLGCLGSSELWQDSAGSGQEPLLLVK